MRLATYNLTSYVQQAQQDPTAAAELANVQFIAPPPFLVTIPVEATTTSSNWAGHVANVSNSSTYYQSSAFYNEPQLASSRCSSNSEVSWVGLGGYGRSQLAQDGTGANTPGLGQHQAWSEILPDQSTIVPQGLSATANKEFFAETQHLSGTGSSSKFNFVLVNEYAGLGLNYDVTANGWAGYSTEWIIERPTVNGSYTNLSNFQTWTVIQAFGNNANPNKLSGQFPLTMQSASTGDILATPSSLSSGGGFTVTQHDCS